MCRVQRDAVSYSNTTCHLYLGRFSSLCQYFVRLALASPVSFPMPALSAEGPRTPAQVTQLGARHGAPRHTVRVHHLPSHRHSARRSLVRLRTGDATRQPVPSVLADRVAVSLLFTSSCPAPSSPAPALLQCSGASSTSWSPRFRLSAAYRESSRSHACSSSEL